MDTSKVAPHIQDLKVIENTENFALLSEGRNLYVTKCTKCHNALRISRYSKLQWEETLPDMTKRSKFNLHETKAITAYIQVVLNSATPAN